MHSTPLRRALVFVFLPLVLAAAGGGCAVPGGLGGGPSEQEQIAYDAAIAHMPGDPAATEKALVAFLQAYPDSALADDAGEELARVSLIQGRRDDAFRWLEHVVVNYPNGDRVDSVRVRLARWEEDRDDDVRARMLLEPVRANRLPLSEQRALYRLQAKLAEESVERVVHLAALRRATAEELRDLDPESAVANRLLETLSSVDAEIDGMLLEMTGEQLGRAGANLRSTPPAGRIRLLLARRALDEGDFDRAKSLVRQAKRYDLTERDEERLASLELRLGLGGELAGRMVLPTYREAAARARVSLEDVGGTIGVVLPLSGRYAPFGQEALRGVMLAADIFDAPQPAVEGGGDALPDVSAPHGEPGLDDPEPLQADMDLSMPSGVRLVVRDTGGSAERAAAAVRELADDGDIVAIIGPIFSDESDAAAREAEAAGIPLLTLSNRVEVSSDRDFVFRLRMTPEDEVGFLVDYAMTELAAKRFAVLYPSTRYGRGMRTRYWEAVEERGGQIVAAAAYDPDATDYSDAIRSMIGFDLLTPKEYVALEEREQALRRGRRLEPQDAALLRKTLYDLVGPELERLPPVVDFDALFIPDAHTRIQLIAPQLAFHEIENVQLLGSSEWNDPELVRIGREHVRGALIATPFHLDSEFRDVREFVSAFQDTFGVDPDQFSSHAFDAVNLVLGQLALGATDRGRVRDGILRVRGYPGVSGVTSIEPDGNARKRPFLLSVKRGRLVGID